MTEHLSDKDLDTASERKAKAFELLKEVYEKIEDARLYYGYELVEYSSHSLDAFLNVDEENDYVFYTLTFKKPKIDEEKVITEAQRILDSIKEPEIKTPKNERQKYTIYGSDGVAYDLYAGQNHVEQTFDLQKEIIELKEEIKKIKEWIEDTTPLLNRLEKLDYIEDDEPQVGPDLSDLASNEEDDENDWIESFKPLFDQMDKHAKDDELDALFYSVQAYNPMGMVSNLITDMTLQHASDDEMARAVKHSMFVIDLEKHKLNYKRSELDNGIDSLKKKYQYEFDKFDYKNLKMDNPIFDYASAGEVSIDDWMKLDKHVEENRLDAFTAAVSTLLQQDFVRCNPIFDNEKDMLKYASAEALKEVVKDDTKQFVEEAKAFVINLVKALEIVNKHNKEKGK